ncbi:hypothetical protein GM418_17825 [Maribellus comscasis]|uniref:Uncharacterized protein n=1 Tax=Maribellus comscasis TaxID=2681766 RepID=A0A6I6K1V3_9BACT|nr:hypothetical protein [Maribellus comscasis]QGY45463.1 hypothetical protein GM418_17825 [Maribellus comscasis]
MQNDTDREKIYIEIITQKISDEFQLAVPGQWQQRDFENLSFQIEEKTGISLSVSTLKRISKNQFQKIPQKNTLNALAQFVGYKDWYDFKTNIPVDNPIPEKKKIPRRKFKWTKKIIYIPVAAIVLFFAILLMLKSQPAQSYSEAKFSSRKNVSEGLPNTVIFDYDISMYDFDSAFIQQSWDTRRRAEIKKNEKYSTSVYYYPGYHRAKLLINDQLVKEIPVYITTEGWLNVIQNPANDIIPIYVKENCISNGQIYISPETVKNYNIDLSNNNHNTCFYYVNENFSGDSDNFTFETRLKNNLEEGATVCQGCEVSIFGEYGRHFLQLCDPGCIGRLYLKFGNDYVSGQNNDLSAFGTDLNAWNDVKMEFRDKVVTIFLNGVEIYKTSYEASNGKIKGVYYNFAGSGAIDYARLYDDKKKLVFSEDFE